MVAKSVVQIDVDSSQFADFYKLFGKYQKQLEEMPESWAKVIGAIDDAGDGMGDFTKSSKSSKEFLMISAIQADAISKAMYRATGVQDKFNTKAKDGAIQMTRMQQASAAMHKSISGMGSVLLKLGTVSASGIGSAIAAIYGATSTLAGQNVQARGLGLKIGQTQAFSANFEKFGLGASDLGNVANAQGDVSKWRAMIAAGLTPQQIQNEDAEQLTYDFARAASGKYRDWQKSGMPAASMAQAYGFTDFFSQQQLRTGASYTDSDWMKAQQKEIADAKRNEIDQGTADQASDVKSALKSDWAQVLNRYNDSLAKAGPDLETLAGAATNAAIAFAGFIDKQVAPVLHEVITGIPTPKGSANYTWADKAFDWLHGTGLGKALDKNILGIGGPGAVSSFANGTLSAPTLDSILDAQLQIESSGGKHLLSPKGAKGPYQFMDATWKQYGNGGNVNDPKASRDAARRYDIDLLKHYNGDVKKAMAAYNWGMGNVDKDIAIHGKDWEKYAPKEPQGYNAKMMQLLLQRGQNVNINITNSTAANVATSMNAAPH